MQLRCKCIVVNIGREKRLTGMSVRIPMGVTALCSNPVNLFDSSSGARRTAVPATQHLKKLPLSKK